MPARQNIFPNPSWVNSTAAWLANWPTFEPPEQARIMILPEGAQQSSAISYFPPFLFKDFFTAKPQRTQSN
jgi:hypothetical protein